MKLKPIECLRRTGAGLKLGSMLIVSGRHTYELHQN